MAPGASLVGLNVFGSANVAFNSVFLEAVNYAVNIDARQRHQRVFRQQPVPRHLASLDLTKQADEARSRPASPSRCPRRRGRDQHDRLARHRPAVISVGASTTYRAYAQSGIGFITTPGVKGWIGNNISALSSGGFAQAGGLWMWSRLVT